MWSINIFVIINMVSYYLSQTIEPKDLLNTIISNDENKPFLFPSTCIFLYLCNSELYFGFGLLFPFDRDSSDSSDEEYSSENIMSSSTFNSPNIDSTYSDFYLLSQN